MGSLSYLLGPALQRERSHLLISDRRHTSCHRTPSTILNRNSRPLSREISLSVPVHPFNSVRYSSHNNLALSSALARPPRPPTTSGNGTGHISSDAVPSGVTIEREIPLRTASTPYLESLLSTTKRDLSLESYNSVANPEVIRNTRNSTEQHMTASSSGTDSVFVTHPHVLLVHDDISDTVVSVRFLIR
ncbi:unnamed protein product [Echinostoma caproni]|uniref:Uncharacterized protein n=1 Tax=Echinostoma caproni TaxID=27848 RepID=A0A183BGH9_9TREM|nr:unnamed protein product [Echinostoma caproni]